MTVMGDLELKAIKPHHGYQYTKEILKKHPTRSNQTLKDYLWGAQNLLRYCVESGYIDINPFRGLDIAKYGEESKETYVYSSEELTKIFKHDWSPQERLLLSILATTGMRPSEAGNLTWERFNSTEHNGIRFFTTLDTENETVRVRTLDRSVMSRYIQNCGCQNKLKEGYSITVRTMMDDVLLALDM